MRKIRNQFIYFSANTLRGLGFNFNEEHDNRISEMQRVMDSLDNHTIQFKIEHAPDGTWSAESVNIDGIMTGGKDPRQVPEMLKDAVFTYFEVPPHLCRDELLRSDNEPVTVRQTVHVGA